MITQNHQSGELLFHPNPDISVQYVPQETSNLKTLPQEVSAKAKCAFYGS